LPVNHTIMNAEDMKTKRDWNA